MNANLHMFHLSSAAARGGTRAQRGTALIFSLIMLLILTVIAITAVTTSTLNEKMAGNLRDKELALQASEAAIRACEAWLRSMQTVDRIPEMMTNPGTTGVWKFEALGNLASSTYDVSWWTTEGVEYGASGSKDITQANRDPRYVIQFRDFIPDSLDAGNTYGQARTEFYRITGWGVGATDNAQVVVNNNYAVHFNK